MWERLEGKAFEKAKQVLGREVQYAMKIGRKTVFARDSGVVRLYVVGDDGYIYTDKVCAAWPINKDSCLEVVNAAVKGEPILPDYRYKRPV